MRPVRLVLSGLHSYRERQEVDFETLCQAGLFGIFGPTGSGKSTILDAITLALYGQVVRTGGSSHPEEVVNQHERKVFVSFTFELGRPGERRRYTIEREFGLDKKGRKRPPEVRLIEHGRHPDEPDKVLESKATAATAAIERLIGLTVQDFTRAVVLPQGQFSRFLTLKGSERNEMLQRIFQLHEYGEKLNERMRVWYEANKAELHRLELELAGLGDAGPEALAAAAEALAQYEREESALQESVAALGEKKRELEQLFQWQREWEEALRQLSALREQEDEVNRLAERIAAVEASIRVRPLAEQVRQRTAEAAELAALLTRQRQERDAAQADAEAAERRYQAALAELQRDEPALLAEKGGLAQAAEWEEELQALAAEIRGDEAETEQLGRELAETDQRLAAAEERLRAGLSELAALEEEIKGCAVTPDERSWLMALRDAKRTWDRERERHAELERERLQAEEQLRALEQERRTQELAWREAVRQRETAQARLHQLEAGPGIAEAELDRLRDELARVKSLGIAWREETRLAERWRQKRMDWEAAWQRACERTRETEAAWRSLEEKRLASQRARQEAEAAWLQRQRDALLHSLRASLEEGQPCPVCGSEHHPYRGLVEVVGVEREEGPATELESFQAALNETEEAARRAYDEWQQARAEQALLAEREAVLREEREAIDGRIRQIRAELERLGAEWVTPDVDLLSLRYREAEAKLNRLASQKERHQTALEAERQNVMQLRERELERKAACERTGALALKLRETLDRLRERLAESANSVERAEQALHQLRRELPVEAIEEQAARLEELDARRELLSGRRSEREQQVKALQDQWQADRERRAQLSARLAAVAERLNLRRGQWQKKESLWRVRTGGRAARALLADIDQRLLRLRSAAAEAEEARQAAAAHLQSLREQLAKGEEAYARQVRELAEAERVFRQALAESGLGEPEQAEALYAERDRLHDYRKRVEAFREQTARLHYEVERLAGLLAGRQADPQQLADVAAEWEQLELSLQAARDQVAVARQTLSHIRHNHARWLELNERLAKLKEEQSRLEDLRKLFEGKAFVQFIAMEKLASIARDASYHLGRMTKNRYALEIGADGEFVLRDEGAGGLRRPVNTLSGGETFLTSLALALALSMEIQMRSGRLEFFFLDEGFGTLDPERLDVVMDALERLRMEDFAIGLISHVPELRARMPRRLVVIPAEPLGAGSRIVMETE